MKPEAPLRSMSPCSLTTLVVSRDLPRLYLYDVFDTAAGCSCWLPETHRQGAATSAWKPQVPGAHMRQLPRTQGTCVQPSERFLVNALEAKYREICDEISY